MFSAEELVKEIAKQSGKGEGDIKKLIREKQRELSNLITEEGAAYIVGRELGTNLIKETRRTLKIKNIVPGMRSVDITAKVVEKSGVREFERNGKPGKVMSFVLADETGTVRLPLWGDEITEAAIAIKEGDVVSVSGSWTTQSERRGMELRLGRGSIRKSESDALKDVVVKQPEEFRPAQQARRRVDIGELEEGMAAAVRGCLVQVYMKQPFYTACPECGSSVTGTCEKHPDAKPVPIAMLSVVIDDGTGNIRTVFFREAAESVLGMKAEEAEAAFMKKGLDAFWKQTDLLGRELLVSGRVRLSSFSNEPELIADAVGEIDMKSECEALLDELGN